MAPLEPHWSQTKSSKPMIVVGQSSVNTLNVQKPLKLCKYTELLTNFCTSWEGAASRSRLAADLAGASMFEGSMASGLKFVWGSFVVWIVSAMRPRLQMQGSRSPCSSCFPKPCACHVCCWLARWGLREAEP